MSLCLFGFSSSMLKSPTEAGWCGQHYISWDFFFLNCTSLQYFFSPEQISSCGDGHYSHFPLTERRITAVDYLTGTSVSVLSLNPSSLQTSSGPGLGLWLYGLWCHGCLDPCPAFYFTISTSSKHVCTSDLGVLWLFHPQLRMWRVLILGWMNTSCFDSNPSLLA